MKESEQASFCSILYKEECSFVRKTVVYYMDHESYLRLDGYEGADLGLTGLDKKIDDHTNSVSIW